MNYQLFCNIFVTKKYIYYEIMLISLTKCTKLTFDLTVTLKCKFTLGIRSYVVCSNLIVRLSLMRKTIIIS